MLHAACETDALLYSCLLLHNMLKSHWNKIAWFSILKLHLTKYYQSSALLARKSSKLPVFPGAPQITAAIRLVPRYLQVNADKSLWTSCLRAAFRGGIWGSLDGLADLLAHRISKAPKIHRKERWFWWKTPFSRYPSPGKLFHRHPSMVCLGLTKQHCLHQRQHSTLRPKVIPFPLWQMSSWWRQDRAEHVLEHRVRQQPGGNPGLLPSAQG